MLEVDDEVALHQLGEIEQLVDLRDRDAGPAPRAGPSRPFAAEDLGLSDEDETARSGREAERGAGARNSPESLVQASPEEDRVEAREG